jgi:RNA polymerase sigma factor (sigma-70 family)
MRKALKLLPQPEEQFVERYERLHAWALSLTSGNEDQADDLVHDAFIQFTLRRAELGKIKNADGYLNRMLRNMFLSQMRRSANLQQLPESMADYDSAELGLRIVDPQTEMQIADELRRICQYACERKETYKGGSVLILRFFHGYYLDEIAQIMRSPMDSIYGFLKIARREVKLYLDDPDSMRLLFNPPLPHTDVWERDRNPIKLLSELRTSIFASRRGVCLTPERLDRGFGKTATQKFDCAELAHVVSCPDCLDEVNRMLDLPLLSERYPTDTLGQSDDPGRHGDGDDGGSKGGGPSVSSTTILKRKHSRRFKEVFDHRPQELRVSVNGFVLGSQKVGQELNEQTISVNIDERIGFVEVFSEQGVRLLFCDIDEPVDGEVEQRAEARLSGGRKLELSLDFRSTWPTLHLLYRDPVLKAVNAVQHETIGLPESIESNDAHAPEAESLSGSRRATPYFLTWLWRLIRSEGFWLRPATVTTLAALILLTAVFLIEFRSRPQLSLAAGVMLAQAIDAEQAMSARTDQVIHRTITLEERKVLSEPGAVATGSPSQLIVRSRIEIWQSPQSAVTARRLYNERGVLIAGDWRRPNGVQTVYHHGSRPQLHLKSEKGDGSSLAFENMWQLDPSAKEFASLIDRVDDARVEANDRVYLISYSKPSAVEVHGLVKTTLSLSRADLHPIEQTFTVQQGNEIREYYFKETSFERHTPTSIAPAVFEPDPELLVPAAVSVNKNADSSKDLTSPAPVAAPGLATAELEVEALQLLNKAGADINDETSVTRTAEGKLRISGLVESGQRRAEIVRALAPLNRNSAVVIEIETVAEAVNRQQRSKTSSGPATVQRIEVTRGEIPVYADLKKYFGTGQTDAQTEEEIRQFAASIMNRSRRAMSHAGALKRLAGRFSEDDRRSLSPEARAKWLVVIRSHARAFEQEYRMLLQELQPIFRVEMAGRDSSDAIAITDDASLARAIEHLLQIGSANDDVIRAAFSISASGSTTAAIRSQQFWRALKIAERLAADIQDSKF